jgi:hypothetical protein
VGILHLKPTVGCQISTLIFVFSFVEWEGLYEYPMNNISRTAKCFSNIKVDIWHPVVGLRCGNPPRHLNQLKTRAIPLIETPSGQKLCHSRYIFHGIFIKTPPPQNKIEIKYPIKIYQGRQSSCTLETSIKGIGRVFNWPNCLGGFLHLKPTVGCQISTLIFEFSFVEWEGL